jgi:hypothetical protein
MNRIFCIGLNKTGTSSLNTALEILGFKSVHYKCRKGQIQKIIEVNYKSGINLLTGISEYDAYTDWCSPSTNHVFTLLDKQYPNSKFILTTRDVESWLISRERHVRKNRRNLAELQKQHPTNTWYNIDKTVWRKEFIEHHAHVLEYFKTREDDLLVIDFTKGEGWEKVCPFLNLPIPEQPFPRRNITSKSSLLAKAWRQLKKTISNI